MNNFEDTKRERFCQIIGEISGSDEYLVVGIDIAKDKHHAFMGTATGKTLYRRLIFENRAHGDLVWVNDHGWKRFIQGVQA